jgi:hypothetical protein
MPNTNILNIAPATRAGAHLLIQLYGGPRSGKTRTALRLARGMVGSHGRIGVLDTESGRARLHADKISGGFVVGELTPPFTPLRYLEAIEEFVRYGIDILVIDSLSHCWEGQGGVLEMADGAERAGRRGLLKWLQPKRDYKKLVNFLLSTRLHLILCSRAKQPIEERVIEIDGAPKRTLITAPWEPIQDKRLKYEMTIVLPMTLDGEYETDPTRLKAPDDLAHLFAGELLTEATGAAIAKWVNGGHPVDHALELFRREAFEIASSGTAPFTKWWSSAQVKRRRAMLRRDFDNLASVARAADAEAEHEREAQEEARRRQIDEITLDAPFGARLAPEQSLISHHSARAA